MPDVIRWIDNITMRKEDFKKGGEKRIYRCGEFGRWMPLVTAEDYADLNAIIDLAR